MACDSEWASHLSKVNPNYGPTAFSGLFLQLANYWETEDFTITDQIASGEDVAIFGKFTYRSLEEDDVFTSPFSIHAKVRDGKITYFQIMGDTYASDSSFRQSGSWTVKTIEDIATFNVGAESRPRDRPVGVLEYELPASSKHTTWRIRCDMPTL